MLLKHHQIFILSLAVFLTACPSRRPIAPIQEGLNTPTISDINRQNPLNTKVSKPTTPKETLKKVVHEQFPDNQRVIINPETNSNNATNGNNTSPIEVIIPPVLPHTNIPQSSVAVGIIPVMQKVIAPFPEKVVVNNQINQVNAAIPNNKILKKYYPVKAQDTWYSVSRLHQVSLENLAQANGITIDELKDAKYQLKVGQTLAVPVTVPNTLAPVNPTNNTIKPVTPVVAKNGVQKHTVQAQDNWYSVARLYKISPTELAKFNQKNLLNDSDLLKTGQVVNIPTSTLTPTTILNKTNINTKSSTNSTKLSEPLFSDLSFPLEGKISSFKVLKNFAQTNNKGVDFATANHQVVQSVAVGRVIYASNQLKDYGNMLMIEHARDRVSVYAFLDKLLVKEGNNVSQNQAIGLTSGKKLHFELRQSEKPVDPLLHLPKF